MSLITTPRQENITGASLSGANPAANRTYALVNANSITTGMVVIVGGAVLTYTTDYTVTAGVITFLNLVWDNQAIELNYFTQVTSPSGSTSGYTNTLQVVRVAGIGVQIEDETVGTGTNLLKSFDLANGNVVALSYTLKYGAVDDNELSDLTETTHYTLDKDSGRLLLTSDGVTALGTNVLYASYIHSPKISDSIMASYMDATEAEVDFRTGNYWGSVVSATETFDGYKYRGGYPETDRPYVYDEYEEQDEIELRYKSVQAITSIKFIDNDGTETTVDSSYVRFDTDGRVVLLQEKIPNGKLNVEVIYTHGYSTVNPLVAELTALMAGIRIYANITGGSYDDATVFTLGRKSISIGEVYVNVREVVRQFEERIKVLLDSLGQKSFVVV